MSRPRVLVISYRYPPQRTMGALRVANLVSRLPSFGWDPEVVTVAPRSNLYTEKGTLPIPSGIPVNRTPDRSLHHIARRFLPREERGGASDRRTLPSKVKERLARIGYAIYRGILCFPDECVLWYLRDYRRIRAAAEAFGPDVLLSSALPPTSHLIASRLSRELRVPWVAEFRDLWTQSYVWVRIPPLRPIEKRLEIRTLRPASALITVSEPLADQLRALHRKPTFVVTNGFDEATKPPPPPPQGAPFTITYTGMIYAGKRDPRMLFEALTELLAEGALPPTGLRIRFVGRKMGPVRALLDRHPQLAEMVEVRGEVSHEEALALQRKSTVLLLMEWTDPLARGDYSGKLFEYLGTRRPILAIAPRDGVIEHLLREVGAGASVCTAEGASAVLRDWFTRYRDDGSLPIGPKDERITRYTWQAQTEQLAAILSRILEGKDRS